MAATPAASPASCARSPVRCSWKRGCPRTRSCSCTWNGPRTAAPSRVWKRPAGPTWASRPPACRMPRPRCWRCCRRHPAACARIAIRMLHARRATRCWRGCRRWARGPRPRSRMRGSNRWWRARCRSRCMRPCWPSACARPGPVSSASPPPWTPSCSARWRRGWRPTSTPCRRGPRPRCWWWTMPAWTHTPMSARWRSAIASDWATWTWCAPGVRPVPPSSRSCTAWPWTMG